MLEQKLVAGEAVTGMFAPAGAEFASPGVLNWSNDEGALLELADRTHPWPAGKQGGFIVHGTPYEGDAVTLMGCRVRRWSFSNVATHISSTTLAVGEHTEPGERWPKANFRPGTLHEWIPETGLSVGAEDDAATFVLTYRRPDRRFVQVADGEVSIYPSGDYGWSYSPDWKVQTAMTFGASPTDPMTIDEHADRYGGPLRAFCIFTADKPDDLLLESYCDPAATPPRPNGGPITTATSFRPSTSPTLERPFGGGWISGIGARRRSDCSLRPSSRAELTRPRDSSRSTPRLRPTTRQYTPLTGPGARGRWRRSHPSTRR
jgi:hypothetical protein